MDPTNFIERHRNKAVTSTIENDSGDNVCPLEPLLKHLALASAAAIDEITNNKTKVRILKSKFFDVINQKLK